MKTSDNCLTNYSWRSANYNNDNKAHDSAQQEILHFADNSASEKYHLHCIHCRTLTRRSQPEREIEKGTRPETRRERGPRYANELHARALKHFPVNTQGESARWKWCVGHRFKWHDFLGWWDWPDEFNEWLNEKQVSNIWHSTFISRDHFWIGIYPIGIRIKEGNPSEKGNLIWLNWNRFQFRSWSWFENMRTIYIIQI